MEGKIETGIDRQIEIANNIRRFKESVYDSGNISKMMEFENLVFEWDKKLKEVCVKKYGSTKPLQAVRGWQVFVGGSEEKEEERLDEEQREFLLKELELFFNKLKETLSIDS